MGLGTDSVLDSIVHPDLHGALSKFYPTLAEIQAGAVSQRANGEQVVVWTTVIVAYGNMTRADAEQRGQSLTTVSAEWVLNLAGWYPAITVAHRVYLGGAIYNIAAVVHDSLSESTRLELERTVH